MKANNRTSKYIGVCWHRENQRWHVTLRHGGVKYLDTYVDDEKEGAKQRDLLIIKKGLPVKLQVLKPVTK